MGMTIDECIKRIGDIRRNYDIWSGLGLTSNESEAFKTTIDTMRKYQKIAEIIKDWEDGRFSDDVGCLRVKAVLDGNYN